MMRSARLPGFILIGLGAYFLLQELDIPLFEEYLSWPIILIVIGIAFLITSLSSKQQKMLILPGSILTLLGIYFWGMQTYPDWPNHWSFYPGMVGLSFLITYVRTRESSHLATAIILLGVFVVAYLIDDLSMILDWWPVALIIIGLYLILRRK